MDYEKKYRETLERASIAYKDEDRHLKATLERIFPELCESEDERIRKVLVGFFKSYKEQGSCGSETFNGIPTENILAWLEKQGEQKPADKVEQKFHEGDWVVTDKGDTIQIATVNPGYYIINNGMEFSKSYVDKCWHLWTIEDAKDGDVLVLETDEVEWVLIYKEIVTASSEIPHDLLRYYSMLSGNYYYGKGVSALVTEDYEEYLKPATKEQRDLLFQKMKEAGYEWDAEKLELKKLDDEEVNGEDYGIDGLWHAQRILEKTLGSVDGYQTDDGILDHKAAITAVKKLYKQKPTWSEEDESIKQWIISDIEKLFSLNKKSTIISNIEIAWLESLKGRIGG